MKTRILGAISTLLVACSGNSHVPQEFVELGLMKTIAEEEGLYWNCLDNIQISEPEANTNLKKGEFNYHGVFTQQSCETDDNTNARFHFSGKIEEDYVNGRMDIEFSYSNISKVIEWKRNTISLIQIREAEIERDIQSAVRDITNGQNGRRAIAKLQANYPTDGFNDKATELFEASVSTNNMSTAILLYNMIHPRPSISELGYSSTGAGERILSKIDEEGYLDWASLSGEDAYALGIALAVRDKKADALESGIDGFIERNRFGWDIKDEFDLRDRQKQLKSELYALAMDVYSKIGNQPIKVKQSTNGRLGSYNFDNKNAALLPPKRNSHHQCSYAKSMKTPINIGLSIDQVKWSPGRNQAMLVDYTGVCMNPTLLSNGVYVDSRQLISVPEDEYRLLIENNPERDVKIDLNLLALDVKSNDNRFKKSPFNIGTIATDMTLINPNTGYEYKIK